MINKKIAAQMRLAQRKKGFTLTEIAIVLGIIGLILGAIWSAASGVYASQNASAFTQSMTQYIAAVRSACNNSCSSVPTVTTSIPNVSNSGITPGTGLSTAVPGDLLLTYTMPSPVNKYSNAVAQGLQAAATATGSFFGPGADAQNAPTPTCAGVSSGGTPKCSGSSGYSSGYVSGGATNQCTTGTTVPTGTCSLVYSGSVTAGTQYTFGFTQSF